MSNSKYVKKTKLYTEEDLENAARRVLRKLFAVHFDKPKKFYIGCLHLTFCEKAGSDVTEVAFKFFKLKATDGKQSPKQGIDERTYREINQLPNPTIESTRQLENQPTNQRQRCDALENVEILTF
uniref:Uncharacterized protein n=1 Tax=Romanomermis culicivorax TaxID=13658 RepID=A0A915JUN9_ROMCU